MSKNNKNKKQKVADEPQHVKIANKSAKGQILEEKSRKRTRTVSQQLEIVQEEPAKIMKNTVNGSVRRKIDFSDKDKQVNNNATKIMVQTRANAGRLTRLVPESKSQRNSNVDGRVQWTNEFMAKIRRSNEKFRQKQEDKKLKNALLLQDGVLAGPSNKGKVVETQGQQQQNDLDDGIITGVEG